MIDQAAGRPVQADPAMVAIYRKVKRGIVCKTVPQNEGFKVPAGWAETPYELGWDDTQPAILVASVHDEPTKDELASLKKGKQQEPTS